MLVVPLGVDGSLGLRTVEELVNIDVQDQIQVAVLDARVIICVRFVRVLISSIRLTSAYMSE